MTNDQNPSLQPNVMVERYAQIADDFASSRPLIDPRPTDIVRGRYEGEQAASAEIARRIRATAPAPQVNVRVTDAMVEAGCAAIMKLRGYEWPASCDDDEQRVARENVSACIAAALAATEGSAE